jgi:hypothetical protein
MKSGVLKVGDRAVWHVPDFFAKTRFTTCKCDSIGTVEQMHDQDGYAYITRLKLDNGEVIDPSIDPDLLRVPGEPCAWVDACREERARP